MKYILTTIILFTSVSLTLTAQNEILLNTDKSVVHWMGSKLLGFSNHHGTVTFSEGKLITSKNKISGGSFIINMHTIANIDGGYHDGLVTHLKDSDFFLVSTYPTAKLVITSVTYEDGTHLRTQADLTIKGITLPIEYLAEIDYDQKMMTTAFTIDRTRWNVVFGSQSVMNIKEHMISDAIEFKVQLYFLDASIDNK